MRSDVCPYLVCELHLAQPPPEPGLPGGAPVQTPPVIYADHSVTLASEKMRPAIGQCVRYRALIGQHKAYLSSRSPLKLLVTSCNSGPPYTFSTTGYLRQKDHLKRLKRVKP